MWLLSDSRNDAQLEDILRRLPPGSAFVFRHYHLPPAARRARFDALRPIAARRRHLLILAQASPAKARQWSAAGIYAPPAQLAQMRWDAAHRPMLRIATAHNMREIIAAQRAGAQAILLSPIFPTRSHPHAKTLGPLRLRQWASRSKIPVIALGGITPSNARQLQSDRLSPARWAAIDGLSESLS